MKSFSKEKYLKKILGLTALVSLSANLYPAEWLSLSDKDYKITEAEKTLEVNDEIQGVNFNGVLIEGNSIIDGTSLKKLNIDIDREEEDFSLVKGIFIKQNDGKKSTKFTTNNLEINIKPILDRQSFIATGVLLNDGSDFEAKDLNINVVASSEREYDDDQIHEDIYASSGIVLNKVLDDNKAKPTIFKADNVNINVTNTKNSDNELYGYELSGVDIFKEEKDYGGDVSFKVNENLNIKVEDKSVKQNPETLTGIFMAAVDSEINLNNTNIKLIGGKNSGLGAGIDIHHLDDLDFKTSGKINSIGNLNIDTTKSPNAAAIVISGSGGEIKADFEKSSSNLKSAGTAIIYKGPESFIDEEDDEKDIENINKIVGRDQIVSLKNAEITTIYSGENETSNSKVYKNLIHVEKGVTNAILNLSGTDTKVVAGDFYNSNLVEVGRDSSLTINLREGLIHGTLGREEMDRSGKDGNLKLIVSDGGVWKLHNKSSKSKLNEVTLKSGGVLDVTDIAKEPYHIMLDGKDGKGTFLNDGGLINMANKSYDDVLNIHGNYEGKNGELKVNTLWNKPNKSKSDKLIIDGKVSGNTVVKAVSISENKEIESIIDGNIVKVSKAISTVPVVETDKDTAENAFTGKAKTTGAGEVQLASKINGGKREFYWVTEIVSDENTEISDTDVVSGNTYVDNNESSNMSEEIKKPSGIKIYSPVVPAYVEIPKINMDLGFNTVGTLNERKGINEKIKDKNGQTWLRFIGENSKEEGKIRFSKKSKTYGIQAGYDFIVKEDENSKQNTAFYIAHTETKIDFSDRYRAEYGKLTKDKYTGEGKVKDLSLGLTTTKYYENGLYFDLVGQFSILKNKYISRDGINAKQKGNSLVLSAELGKSYNLTNDWIIEPQTQLIYQYLKLRDFDDGVKRVSYGNDGAVRGRVGIKVSNQFVYGIVNIWHNFNDSTEVNIGKDRIKEKYSTTSGEIGLGLQYPINTSISIYGDMRYEKTFKVNSKNSSYRGTLGIKYSW